jgi:hypothetical protein
MLLQPLAVLAVIGSRNWPALEDGPGGLVGSGLHDHAVVELVRRDELTAGWQGAENSWFGRSG